MTLITALLKLPEIIATHLFPLEEDRVIVDLVNALKDAPSFSEEKEAKRL